MQTNHTPGPTDYSSDPLAALLRPPNGSWAKLHYYGKRYGLLHAVCSYIGRKWFGFWLLVGPLVTRRYLRRWLAHPGPHALNLGGGSVLSSQWLTADIDPRSDVFMNVTRPLPIPKNTLDVVFSEEVIEHVSREAGFKMLLECFRVLKPGGVLRITTPSFDYFAHRAVSETNAVQEINDIFYGHGHRFIYSNAALREALTRAGFVNVTPSSYRDPKSRYGCFDSHPARFAIGLPEWSQYWEAEKPAPKT
jgi:predicted SAM-dependent methyltransferase